MVEQRNPVFLLYNYLFNMGMYELAMLFAELNSCNFGQLGNSGECLGNGLIAVLFEFLKQIIYYLLEYFWLILPTVFL